MHLLGLRLRRGPLLVGRHVALRRVRRQRIDEDVSGPLLRHHRTGRCGDEDLGHPALRSRRADDLVREMLAIRLHQERVADVRAIRIIADALLGQHLPERAVRRRLPAPEHLHDRVSAFGLDRADEVAHLRVRDCLEVLTVRRIIGPEPADGPSGGCGEVVAHVGCHVRERLPALEPVERCLRLLLGGVELLISWLVAGRGILRQRLHQDQLRVHQRIEREALGEARFELLVADAHVERIGTRGEHRALDQRIGARRCQGWRAAG